MLWIATNHSWKLMARPSWAEITNNCGGEQLIYKDEDGECIIISNEEDLEEALQHVAPLLGGSIYVTLRSATPRSRIGGYLHRFGKLHIDGAEVHPSVLKEICQDLDRTMPQNPDFAKASGRDALQWLLTHVAAMRPHIGYCQGLNFVSAMSLLLTQSNPGCGWLNSEKEAALSVVLGLVDILPPAFYSDDPAHGLPVELSGLRAAAFAAERLVVRHHPTLAEHCDQVGLPVHFFACRWLPRLFVGVLPQDTVVQIWDLIVEYDVTGMLATMAAVLLSHAALLLECCEPQRMIFTLDDACSNLYDSTPLLEAIAWLLDEPDEIQLLMSTCLMAERDEVIAREETRHAEETDGVQEELETTAGAQRHCLEDRQLAHRMTVSGASTALEIGLDGPSVSNCTSVFRQCDQEECVNRTVTQQEWVTTACRSSHLQNSSVDDHELQSWLKEDRVSSDSAYTLGEHGDDSHACHSGQQLVDMPDLDEECSICLESMLGMETVKLGCLHEFHAACIKQWLESSTSHLCPMCNTDVDSCLRTPNLNPTDSHDKAVELSNDCETTSPSLFAKFRQSLFGKKSRPMTLRADVEPQRPQLHRRRVETDVEKLLVRSGML